MRKLTQPKVLEVIVANRQDAQEAVAGGADRLEIVRDLHLAGLTPPTTVVKEIIDSVSIPVRVMLRERDSFFLAESADVENLCELARRFQDMGVAGIVTGYVRGGRPDLETLVRISQAAPACKITFHRAFDSLAEPSRAIDALHQVSNIDRILSNGGEGTWLERRASLEAWQAEALPAIRFLIAAGLEDQILADIQSHPTLHEVHVGRAARIHPHPDSPVSCAQVRRLKALLS